MSYKVYAEHYYNDRRTWDEVLHFNSLEDLEIWMHEHGGREWIPTRDDIHRIALGMMSDDGKWWIHKIEGPGMNRVNIYFSDGKHTHGAKHMSGKVERMLERFEEQYENPEQFFVD